MCPSRSLFGEETVRQFLIAGLNDCHSDVYNALFACEGAPESHVSRALSQYAHTLKGMKAYCIQAYANALQVIPTALAENLGLHPIAIVTKLRNRHSVGERNAGINVRKVCSP